MDLNKHKGYHRLTAFLEARRPPAIAFSGGTDSAFLVWVSRQVLGNDMHAYTFDTPYMNHREIREAQEFCKSYNIPHTVLPLPMPREILNNPEIRCYLCKLTLFTHLQNRARHDGLCCVMEGTNRDDLDTHRPGRQAIKELGILSPLKEAGLTKEEIRELSREAGLPTWDKPSNACLLTRLPYSHKVTEELLSRIGKAEELLHEKGFSTVRVRTHGSLARIELIPEEMERIFNRELKEEIIRKMKALGYRFITVDMEGFRSGSYDQTSQKRK